MTITDSERPRVAAAIRTAGELFEVHGDLMLTLTHDWARGPKAANLDPDSRGNRWDKENQAFIPSDPTGEAVLHARADLHPELQKRLARMVEDAYWIRDLAHVLAPIVAPSEMNDKDERWCNHHLRVGICEPRHRGADCRFCYDFRLLWKVYPPLRLVKDRNEGKKITEQSIKAALEAEGLILDEVKGVAKEIRKARGTTGRPNQNQKRKAG